MLSGNSAGAFTAVPAGVVLHGTRSGQPYDTDAEYRATLNYVRNGAGGLGWNVTVSDDTLCEHLRPGLYGWHARSASSQFLSIEFAQSDITRPISDAQVRAAAWWIAHARTVWPSLPLHFPGHSELDQSGATGQRDFKSDPFSVGDPRMDELRGRLMRRLEEAHGVV